MPQDVTPTPQDGPPDDAESRRPGGLAWLLVAGGALPLVLAGSAARTWFSGARDPDFFSYDPATDLTPGIASVSFADRWASFDEAVPFTPALLAACLGVTVLAAVTLAGRPSWLVPGRAARLAAAAVAALTAAAAVGLLVAGVVAAGTDPVTTSSGGRLSPTTTADLVGPLGVGLLTGLVAGFACALLAHPPQAPAAVPAAASDPDPAPAPAERPDPGPAPGPDPAAAGAVEPGLPSDTAAERGFPRPAPGQLDRYRRP